MWVIIGFFIIISFSVFLNIYLKIKDKNLLETVTKSYRGTKSEKRLVLRLLKYGIPAEDIFHDLYLEKSNNNYSQIDLVIITNVGIIVFEVKDYSGWLFGKGNQDKWTQVLAYGREKYRFYNPIKQNNGHITALKKQLEQFDNVPFYSVIVFYGDCEFKDISFIPQGTFLTYSERVLDVMNTIINKNVPVNYSNKLEVIRILKEAVNNGENKNVQKKHIENIKDMLGKERIFE